MIPSLTPQAIAERKTWQYKTLAYTHGNKSKIGALLIAMLGRRVNPPCFHVQGMKITKDGVPLILYKADTRSAWRIERAYESTEELRDAFRGLAAACELSDGETESLFAELRKFIFKDERAKSTLD